MEITTQTAPVSKTQLWAGRIISALPVLFLLFDGVIHLTRIAPVVDSFNQLGYPIVLALGLGIIELVCVVLYVVPPTSVLGAILLTGYLGGAVASNLRIGAPLFSNALFPVYVGVLLWAGLYLRSNRLRALLPLRR
jgi:hypothetical protein